MPAGFRKDPPLWLQRKIGLISNESNKLSAGGKIQINTSDLDIGRIQKLLKELKRLHFFTYASGDPIAIQKDTRLD